MTTATATELIIPEPLREKARALSLPDSLAADLLRAYAPHAVAGSAIKAKLASLPAVGPSDAREIRLAMVKVRTGSDKTRKELKADSLLRGKAIDGLHAMIELDATAVEKQMEDIEKAAERAEAARIAALRDERLAALRPYVSQAEMYQVEKMDDKAFAELLDSSRIAHESRERARIEAEKAAAAKIEADRLAAIELERKRQEELAAAKAEAEAMRKRAAEEAEARRVADEKAAAERKVAEEVAAKERAKVEAERAAERAKTAAADQAARDEKRRADLAQYAADAAEHHRKEEAKRAEQREADAKAARLREEAKAKAEAEEAQRLAAERAAATPDADKIARFAGEVASMPIPALSDARSAQREQIIAQRDKFAAWLSGMARKLRE